MKRAIFVLGAFALTAQVLCLRELAVAFHGTELYLGASLAAWLLLTGLGSGVLGRLADRFMTPVRALSATFVAAGIALPATLIVLRWAPRLLPGRAGAVVPYWQMRLVALPTLAPLCVTIGFAFVLACRTARPHASSDGSAIARAYVMEAAGAVVSGVLFSYVLVQWLPAIQIAAGAGLLMVVAGWLVMRRTAPPSALGWAGIVLPALVLLALLLPPVGQTVDFVSKKLRIPGYVLLESRETPYGQLDVGLREKQRVFFVDGGVAGSTDDLVSAEEVAHVSLLAHERPKDVLLVGGGAIGVVPQLLKHASVRRVDYVELDPELVRLTFAHGTRENKAALASDRVTIHARIDGRGFLQRTERRFDVVILDQPDPITAVTNRLYTLECFRAARGALRENGVLMVNLTGSPSYMSRELRLLSASILKTLEQAFPEGGVGLVACDGINYFFASPAAEALDVSADTLAKRYEQRGLEVEWLSPRMLRRYASSRRVGETLAMIRSATDAAVNTDQRPITYYYAMLFRNRLYQRGERRAVWERLTLAWVGGLVFLAIVAAVVGGFAIEERRRVSVPAAVLGAGFCGLAFEMVLILAFQSLVGIVFSFMAVLFAAFMGGVALGGVVGQWAGKRGAAALVVGLAGLAAGGILTPVGLGALAEVSRDIPTLGIEGIFVGATLILGVLVGCVFSSGAHLYRGARGAVARTAGFLYAADLAGACGGALLVTALLIPVLGVTETCYAATLVALGALAQFVISERRA